MRWQREHKDETIMHPAVNSTSVNTMLQVSWKTYIQAPISQSLMTGRCCMVQYRTATRHISSRILHSLLYQCLQSEDSLLQQPQYSPGIFWPPKWIASRALSTQITTATMSTLATLCLWLLWYSIRKHQENASLTCYFERKCLNSAHYYQHCSR